MKLVETITKINNDPSVAVYADTPFTAESEARIGQTCFENGGLLDSKEWVGNGDSLNSRATDWIEPDDFDVMEDEIEAVENFVSDELIPQLEEERVGREEVRGLF